MINRIRDHGKSVLSVSEGTGLELWLCDMMVWESNLGLCFAESEVQMCEA